MTETNFYLGLAFECSRCYSIVIIVKPGNKNKNKHNIRCCNKTMTEINALQQEFFKLPEHK